MERIELNTTMVKNKKANIMAASFIGKIHDALLDCKESEMIKINVSELKAHHLKSTQALRNRLCKLDLIKGFKVRLNTVGDAVYVYKTKIDC